MKMLISTIDNKGIQSLDELSTEEMNFVHKPKPLIEAFELEKAVVLYCNDELWELIKKFRKSPSTFDMVQLAKMYFQIKKIFEEKVNVSNNPL